jgi:hypothetical protein
MIIPTTAARYTEAPVNTNRPRETVTCQMEFWTHTSRNLAVGLLRHISIDEGKTQPGDRIAPSATFTGGRAPYGVRTGGRRTRYARCVWGSLEPFPCSGRPGLAGVLVSGLLAQKLAGTKQEFLYRKAVVCLCRECRLGAKLRVVFIDGRVRRGTEVKRGGPRRAPPRKY